MTSLSPLPIWQQFNGSGVPVAGGLLYTYESGTVDPKKTYDKDGNEHSNPVVFDSEGRATIRLENGAYTMVFTDGVGAVEFRYDVIEGVTIWTVDNIVGGGSGSSFLVVDTMADLLAIDNTAADMVLVRRYDAARDGGGGIFTWDAAATADDGGVYVKPTGRTEAGRWFREFTGNPNPRWWGAVGDGTTDDSDAFIACLTYAATINSGIDLDFGTFLVTDTVPFSNIPVYMNSAGIKWSGFNLSINPVIAISDTKQHFFYGCCDEPEFPDDPAGIFAEIKNVWLDGVSSGWYQSSLGSDITNLTVRVGNLESQMIMVTNQIDAIGGDVNTIKNVTIPNLQAQIDAIGLSGAGKTTYGSLMLAGTGSSGVPVSQASWKKEATGAEIYVYIKSAGSWTAGAAKIYVGAVDYIQSFDTSITNSLNALCAKVAADPNVQSCSYNETNKTINLVFKVGLGEAITSDLSSISGTDTPMTFTIRVTERVTLNLTRATGFNTGTVLEFSPVLPASIRPVSNIYLPATFTIGGLTHLGLLKINSAGLVSLLKWDTPQQVFVPSGFTGSSTVMEAFTGYYDIATS